MPPRRSLTLALLALTATALWTAAAAMALVYANPTILHFQWLGAGFAAVGAAGGLVATWYAAQAFADGHGGLRVVAGALAASSLAAALGEIVVGVTLWNFEGLKFIF